MASWCTRYHEFEALLPSHLELLIDEEDWVMSASAKWCPRLYCLEHKKEIRPTPLGDLVRTKAIGCSDCRRFVKPWQMSHSELSRHVAPHEIVTNEEVYKKQRKR